MISTRSLHKLALLSTAVLSIAAMPVQAQETRDWRYWPFDQMSPWNHPIGSNAQYVDVPNLNSLTSSINYADKWTVGVAIAKESDPLASILWKSDWPNTNWSFLDQGGKNCGNSAAQESIVRQGTTTQVKWDANTYSTLSAPDTSKLLWPSTFHKAGDDYVSRIHMPAGVCPSADSDGHLVVFQPNGWVLNTYATVVLANRDIVADMASFSNAKGDGTGFWNGRRASMVPSYAGLIRNGEITSGKIRHALAVVMSPNILKNQAMWPAAAFDRNSGYTGTLPMGALLAIPAKVDINNIGLSEKGKIIARALQDYGGYVVDRGGSGWTLQAEFGNKEIRWTNDWNDFLIISKNIKWVSNNSSYNRGGGGTLRTALAPPFADGTGIEVVKPPAPTPTPTPAPTPAPTPGTTAPSLSTSGSYSIIGRASSKCLDVRGNSTANLALLIQWQCTGGSNQKFRLVNAGSGYYSIVALHSNKCIDVPNGNPANGTGIIQYSCNGGPQQLFRFNKLSDGTYTITSKLNTNQCFDIKNRSEPENQSERLWL